MRRSVVIGCAGYLPENIVSNSELAKQLDTSDEWIQSRSGILKRHIAASNELTSDLAYKSADAAIIASGISVLDIDLIVVATSTPDVTFPATATAVQAKLGAKNAVAFDLQAVCSGFVYAMATVDNFIKSSQYDLALVIGAETFSRILDWDDRSTCVLFGDGAGTVKEFYLRIYIQTEGYMIFCMLMVARLQQEKLVICVWKEKKFFVTR